jgi:hypothetical protein
MRFSWLPVLAPGTAKSTGVSDSPLLLCVKHVQFCRTNRFSKEQPALAAHH